MVGAGPVGCRVAELTAKKGLKTALIDKKKEIGRPVQCTGLVSYRLKTILPDLPQNVILNSVNSAKFFSASRKLELKSKKPFYVIDREKLDKFLFAKARRAEAKISTPVLFKGFEKQKERKEVEIRGGPFRQIKEEELLTVSTSAGKMQTKILVGADGPLSDVAVATGFQRPANMLTGAQSTISTKSSFDAKAVELFFNSTISPDFFGWVVPLNSDEARIGVAAKKDVTMYLKRLIKKRTGGEVKASAAKPDVAGKINFGLMQRTAASRVMVVGDAAAQLKPFSGGGVVYGLIGAAHCANACIKATRENDFSAEFFEREYDRKWKDQLASPIKRGMRYRKALCGSDGRVSDTRVNLIFGLGRHLKFMLETFDVDLL